MRPLVALGVLFAAVSPAVAQMTVQKPYHKEWGNSKAGASLDVPLSMTVQPNFAQVRAQVDGKVTLFGKSATVVSVDAEAHAKPGDGSAYLKVKLIGFKVLDKQSDPNQAAKNGLGPYIDTPPFTRFESLPAYEQVFPVGPIPVTVRAELGVGISMGARLGVSPFGVYGQGSVRSWTSGKVSAGVTFRLAYVRLEADLTFLDTTWSLDTQVSWNKGFSGEAKVTFEAVHLVLKLVAGFEYPSISIRRWRVRITWKKKDVASVTLFDRGWGKQVIPIWHS